MKSKPCAIAILLAGACFGAAAAWAETGGVILVTPDDLK
jgi:hypothetical protein